MVHTEKETEAIDVLKRIFGIVSFSSSLLVPSDMDDISEKVREFSRGILTEGMSFAIRSRRVGEHSYTSVELAGKLGSDILSEIKGLQVDLSHPDVEIFVEVRRDIAFIFDRIIPGPAGLPLGSQGEVLGKAENEDEMLALWLMMKRGSKTHVAYTRTKEFVNPLEAWDPRLKVYKIDSLKDLLPLSRRIEAKGLVLRWEERESLLAGTELPLFFPTIALTGKDKKRLLKIVKDPLSI